jgi:hypothetical protein
MKRPPNRLKRERATIEAMVRLYCADHHQTRESPCPVCTSLVEYANEKLDRCSFGEEKPPCNKCTVHCYRPEQREQVRIIMRYAGPRMLTKHPVMAIMHVVDGKRARSRMPHQLS